MSGLPPPSRNAIMRGMGSEQSWIVGRRAEVAQLEGLLEGVGRAGRALVVRGEAGIGKSTLLAATAKLAKVRAMVVLTTGGVEAEAQLPFAGLHRLLRPLLGRLDSLP